MTGVVHLQSDILCSSDQGVLTRLWRCAPQAALHLAEPATAGIAAAGAGAANATARLPSMWAHLPAAASTGMRVRPVAAVHVWVPDLRSRSQGCSSPRKPSSWVRILNLCSNPKNVCEHTSMLLQGRVAALWTGVGATLARDVPFSALYWQLLEPIRAAMLPSPQHALGQQQQLQHQHPQAVSTNSDQVSRGGSVGANSVHTASGQPASRRQIIVANLVAGSTAGAVAAAVTTPLDVVKTRAQLADGGSSGGGGGAGSSIRASLRAIHADSGVRGLFAGVGPRAVRAAPACAIVVASYEVRPVHSHVTCESFARQTVLTGARMCNVVRRPPAGA